MAQDVPQDGSKQMTLKYISSVIGRGPSGKEYMLCKTFSASPVVVLGMAKTSPPANTLHTQSGLKDERIVLLHALTQAKRLLLLGTFHDTVPSVWAKILLLCKLCLCMQREALTLHMLSLGSRQLVPYMHARCSKQVVI